MKINVLDAGLGSRGGHHFDFDRTLMRSLAQAGHDVHLYGYVGMDDDVVADLSAHGPVTRLLRPYHYDELDPPEFYALKLETFLRNSELLAEDLREVRDADLWIWPSMRSEDLRGTVLSGTQAAVAGGIHWDPGITTREIGAMTWRSAMLAAERTGVRFAPCSPESELRHRFAPIVPSGRFKVLPHPYDGPPLAAPKTELKRIGFFGHQRRERGVDLLQNLARALIKRGYDVTIQDSGFDTDGLDLEGVEVLGFVDNLAEAITACDLVILPYDADQYRNKGSGILAQCMSVGVPVIGPLGSIPGRIIEQHQVGPLFPFLTAQAVYDTIRYAEKRYQAYAETAFRVAHRFARHNGSARFAEAFVALAG